MIGAIKEPKRGHAVSIVSFDDYKKWEKFNSLQFKYAKCSTCTNKLDYSLIDNTKGFLTEYSMSTASEDMAETFSFLMTTSNPY